MKPPLSYSLSYAGFGGGIKSTDCEHPVATFGYVDDAEHFGPMFAAAPDLLAACRPAVEWGQKFNPPDDPTVVIELTREEFAALVAAVNKAEEVQP